MRGDRPQGTKLLVATIGLATVSYVGCGNAHPPGNLMVTPDPTETPTATAMPDEHPPGNLMAPPNVPTAEPTAPPSGSASSTGSAVVPTKVGPPPKEMPPGNLMAPPPPPPASAKPKK